MPSRSRRRWVLVALGVAIALLLLGGAAISWHFSSSVLVPDRSGWPEDIRVESVLPGRVTLESTDETGRPGVYGLDWKAGHAVIGPILSSGEDVVTRRLREVRGYLVPGLDVSLNTHVFSGNPLDGRGLPFRSRRIKGELGPMPAWEIPAQSGPPVKAGDGAATKPSLNRTWAIVVHGINDNPQVGLRLAPFLREAGMTSLLITYRDDLGAPGSPDGFHHMGLTEWNDLEAAAQMALDRGAKRLVLIGYSMGGTLVTQFMQKSALADRVEALVLDAPALDWRKTISFNATQMGLPSLASLPVEWAIGVRIDADWDSLDALQHTEDFHLPILVFHGTEDEVVPIETSEDFAEDLPNWVTYHAVPQAGHTQSWNVNPPLYEHRLDQFLSQIEPPMSLHRTQTNPGQ